jgi:hypothetical protein
VDLEDQSAYAGWPIRPYLAQITRAWLLGRFLSRLLRYPLPVWRLYVAEGREGSYGLSASTIDNSMHIRTRRSAQQYSAD